MRQSKLILKKFDHPKSVTLTSDTRSGCSRRPCTRWLRQSIASSLVVTSMALSSVHSLADDTFELPKPPQATRSLKAPRVTAGPQSPKGTSPFVQRPNTSSARTNALIQVGFRKDVQRVASRQGADDDLLAPMPTGTSGTPSSSNNVPSREPSPYDDVLLPPKLDIQKQPTNGNSSTRAQKQATEDDDLLLPAPRQSQEVPSEVIPSPSDRRVPRSNSGDEFAPDLTQDEPVSDDVKVERRGTTPWERPRLDGPAEQVVPLPIRPAPGDFPGYDNREVDKDQLPEPRRTFPLPKQQPAPQVPQNGIPSSQYPGAIQAIPGPGQSESGMNHPSGDEYFSAPSHGEIYEGQPFAYETFVPRWNSDPSLRHWFPNRQAYVPPTAAQPAWNYGWHDAGYRPVDPNPIAENRPTLAPLDTLPERLQSRHWQFHVTKDLPYTASHEPIMGECTQLVPYEPGDFAPNPHTPQPLDPCREIQTYYGKYWVDTQRPWIEWWRPFYTGGMYAPGIPVFSETNLLTPSFLVYGDYRTGVGIHRSEGQDQRSWAHRLNLDMDLRLTGTERFHMFTGPLDHNGRFTRLDFSDNPAEFEEELDFQLDTAFFEGDLGAIVGSFRGDDAPFDLPFTCGLVPLLYQNGIWMEDAILGMAVAAPWRHSRPLNWANYEATFFAGFNQVTSPAFQNDDNAAAVYGTAWFIEAYNGYIELDYAYLDDLDELGRSYHNAAVAYTRRYFGRISNSVRLIGNAGQRGRAIDRTADGGLLLFENSWIGTHPSTIVPYWNLFVGSGRPQSVARAGNSGGILRNTGINFETDGLTGYPTLNATGSNSYGGAVGVNMLSADFRKQFIVEFSALDRYGDPLISNIAGPQYAVGSRYQQSINNRCLWRVDVMNGWLDNAPDIVGTRGEFRWKF